MVGGRGRGRREQVPNEEAQRRDRSVQDTMIANLHRQVAELTQRLVAQDFEDREASDHDTNSTFENPYHNRTLFREQHGREELHGDLGFQVDLLEFFGTLQVEGFVDWINEVEHIFYYKEVPDRVKMKLIAIKLKGRASTWAHDQSMITRSSFTKWSLRTIYLRRRSIWSVSEAYQCAYAVKKQQIRRPVIRSDHNSRPVHPQDSRKKLLIEENAEDETEEIGEPVYDDDETDDVLYGDGHETLVVRKSLLTPKGDSGDDWLRTNIFHMTCTVADKVCKMIIDSDNCENVVSEEVVQKLQLKTDRHPKPYKLSWLNKGSEILDEIEHGGVVYALLPYDNSAVDVDTYLPVEVQRLLAEFSNLMPDDLPPRLPPMRDIQHQIDLVPGSSFPNQPAYRLSPKEAEEIRPGDEWKTTFKMPKGLYEWMVMPFGLSNAPMVGGGRGQFSTGQAEETEAPVLALPDFDKVFEVNCDASGVGIGGVLRQTDRPVAFFSEKLSGSKKNYSTYDLEFYAIVQFLKHWHHYLVQKEFILFTDHEALKYINGQHKLSRRHAKWVTYLQEFTFTLRHQAGSLNRVADALSLRTLLLTTLSTKVAGFETFIDMYTADPFFGRIFQEQIISELHNEGHFGRDKTLALISSEFYWPKLTSDVAHYVDRFYVCQWSKGVLTNAGLYIPLPVPEAPWFDVSMDFVLACRKTMEADRIVYLYFKEIVRLHGVPQSITSDRDTKFISHFWKSLWGKLGTQLNFSSTYHPQTDGQTEVVNRSMGNLLRCLEGTKPKQWDLALPQAEFSYNRSKNITTGLSPFEIVYGQNSSGVLDLAHIPRIGRFSPKENEMAKYLRGIHGQVKHTIHESNTKYKTRVDSHRRQVLFDVGDFVWVVLTRDRFLVGEYNKLKDRKIRPYEVVQKINDNAYRLRLPSHLKTSDVFNVKHLSPCFVDCDDTTLNSRTSSFQPGVTYIGGSETDDAELSDCTLMALRYRELADQRKGGS
ncbi:hypothetical protein F3Y22_tig00110515pilonHSYRG00071 [Hibiscus syriacus]|uniref:Integrase catalytic domain-containing protein n=1 Tax=Hibiscus syriacus TaxID=106335 RepID=A0A6A3AFQ6_HIBSY|nr:hypothetical protein F3Y22_tig00110515pilonHSYRG00071 [Hibiscus syriacus]